MNNWDAADTLGLENLNVSYESAFKATEALKAQYRSTRSSNRFNEVVEAWKTLESYLKTESQQVELAQVVEAEKTEAEDKIQALRDSFEEQKQNRKFTLIPDFVLR